MFSDESYLLLSNFWQFTAPEDVNLFFIPLKRVSQSKNSLDQSEALNNFSRNLISALSQSAITLCLTLAGHFQMTTYIILKWDTAYLNSFAQKTTILNDKNSSMVEHKHVRPHNWGVSHALSAIDFGLFGIWQSVRKPAVTFEILNVDFQIQQIRIPWSFFLWINITSKDIDKH